MEGLQDDVEGKKTIRNRNNEQMVDVTGSQNSGPILRERAAPNEKCLYTRVTLTNTM